MKKNLKVLACAVLAMGIAGGAHAKETLRVTLQIPAKHILGQNVLAFKKIVEERSKGELELEIYDSAQLYKGTEVPQAVSSGAIDMGIVELGVYTGTIPAAGAFSVPFLFPSEAAIAKATAPDSAVRQAIDGAILKTGARVIWWQAYGLVQMLSKKAPVRLPTDLKGKKVRVISKPIGEFVADQGGAPIVIDGAEQLIAYQRGTVDIGMSGTTATQSRHIYDVMDYITMTNHSDVEFLVLINDRRFQKLKPEQQALLQEAARTVEADLRKNTEKLNAEAKEFLRTKTKMQVVDLTPAEAKAWHDAAQPTIKNFAQQNGPLAKQVVDAALKAQ